MRFITTSGLVLLAACSSGGGASGSLSGAGPGPGTADGGVAAGSDAGGPRDFGGFSDAHAPADAQGAFCQWIPGMYSVHYEVLGGTTQCSPIQDTTISITSATADGGTANPNCTLLVDDANCSSMTDCTTDTNGYTTKQYIAMYDLGHPVVSGTMSYQTTRDSDGTVISDCAYSIKYTKL
jgi:hypothetical protein